MKVISRVNRPKTRVFLVGCPRSGTTLLQSLLAAHQEVISFPESHFFCNLFAEYEPKRRLFRIASRRARIRLEKFLRDVGCQEVQEYLPGQHILFTWQYTSFFIRLLDRLATERNKSIWIEKTPPHLQYVKYIEERVNEAKFIHIIRNGADAIASLYEVRNQYPSTWLEKSDLDSCIDRWIRDITISSEYVGRKNHIFISYEELVEAPQKVLKEICTFLGVDFDENMTQNYKAVSKHLILNHEPWKATVSADIYNRNSEKFYCVFDQGQRTHVLKRTSSVNLAQLFNW